MKIEISPEMVEEIIRKEMTDIIEYMESLGEHEMNLPMVSHEFKEEMKYRKKILKAAKTIKQYYSVPGSSDE